MSEPYLEVEKEPKGYRIRIVHDDLRRDFEEILVPTGLVPELLEKLPRADF